MTEPSREDELLDYAREKVEDDKRRESNSNGAGQAPSAKALPLTFFDDLSDTPALKPWLIKNVLARDETSSWIGPPGSGKSALADDIAVHAGGGKEWRGHRVNLYRLLERSREAATAWLTPPCFRPAPNKILTMPRNSRRACWATARSVKAGTLKNSPLEKLRFDITEYEFERLL